MYKKFINILMLSAVAACAFAPAVLADEDNQGFIYGTVVTRSGNEYKGFLRWGSQEAFWDDLFHSAKEDMPFYDELDKEDRKKLEKGDRKSFSLFDKIVLRVEGSSGFSRMFIARFGDIARIEPHGEGDATVHMRDGKSYDVSGAADDVTSDIRVTDDALGEIDVKWDRIDEIRFEQAPSGAKHKDKRLYGRVETDEGDFEGFIQWDKQECLTSDELDGDTEDGDVSIPMGALRSIARRSSRSSDVVLKDGREMTLRGSNDVNDENRGIMVEDPNYGRVTVGWDAFDKLTFEETNRTGRAYDDYPALGDLTGVVTDDDGNTYRGRIAIDVDENQKWEMLNGSIGDVKFDIPLYMVASIEPGRNDSMVVLRNGKRLELEEGQDVGSDNAGVVIIREGGSLKYLRWRHVERIELDQ